MSELGIYQDFAKSLAAEAGVVMKRYFRAEDIGTIWKEDDTPLTVADTLINKNVISSVKDRYPEHGILGEEDSYMPERNLVWVLDPIDGTVPFSLGMPLSTFSLALVDRKDGQSLVAVIFDPFLDHLYSAMRNQGAYLNDIKIKTSSTDTLEQQYVSVLGRWPGLGACIDELYSKKASCMSLISQAYCAAKVASGELAGSIFAYGSPWDSAAASLIVEEAGGIVTNMKGIIRRYDEFSDGCILSCNQKVHGQLLEIVKNAYPRH